MGVGYSPQRRGVGCWSSGMTVKEGHVLSGVWG